MADKGKKAAKEARLAAALKKNIGRRKEASPPPRERRGQGVGRTTASDD